MISGEGFQYKQSKQKEQNDTTDQMLEELTKTERGKLSIEIVDLKFLVKDLEKNFETLARARARLKLSQDLKARGNS